MRAALLFLVVLLGVAHGLQRYYIPLFFSLCKLVQHTMNS